MKPTDITSALALQQSPRPTSALHRISTMTPVESVVADIVAGIKQAFEYPWDISKRKIIFETNPPGFQLSLLLSIGDDQGYEIVDEPIAEVMADKDKMAAVKEKIIAVLKDENWPSSYSNIIMSEVGAFFGDGQRYIQIQILARI